jgi:hypothetical protein
MLPYKNHTRALTFLANLSIGPALLLLVGAGSIRSQVPDSDILYVGDVTNNTVKRFGAVSGLPITGGSKSGVFVAPGSGGLAGPRGVLVKSGSLLVVNQNVDLPKLGEVLRYKLADGAPDGALVSSSDANAPFLPRGMVSSQGVVYVANFLASDKPNFPPGGVLAFDETGKFLREGSLPNNGVKFHPRGLVVGPNGMLYVSNFPDLKRGTGGEVLVFDPKTLNFVGAFISDKGGPGQLNRPEGLVFGPDGNLYITSFRADASDTDSIRIYNGNGAFLGKIDLDTVGQPRAVAQALLFGPGGFLFVPISGGGPDTGAVRRYDVSIKTFPFTNFVKPGGPLGEGWYLTFGKTDPGTLEYDPQN